MNEKTCKRGPRLYLAGPMRTIPFFNFPAFDARRDHLRYLGWDVVSPADIDRASGFDATTLPADTDWGVVPEAAGTLDDIMLRDIAALETCDAIFLMHGWEESCGANRELAEARKLGLREFYEDVCASPDPKVMEPRDFADDLQKHDDAVNAARSAFIRAVIIGESVQTNDATPASTEVRVTDPTTGGQKGDKLCRMDLIPAGPLWELGVHYGVGARKYDDNQWMNGYKWHLSFAAALRHMWQFWRGEDIDSETGSKHVIAAAWHCMTLAWFMDHRRSHDDRPKETPA